MNFVCTRCGRKEAVTTRAAHCTCGGLWKLEADLPAFDLSGAPGETKRNDSGREKHGFRPRNPENSRKSDAQSCRRLRDMLWSRTW